jgi:hypothetical protein
MASVTVTTSVADWIMVIFSALLGMLNYLQGQTVFTTAVYVMAGIIFIDAVLNFEMKQLQSAGTPAATPAAPKITFVKLPTFLYKSIRRQIFLQYRK